MTSQTMTRSCASAVVCSRSMASVAIWTAVWKPKLTSVAFTSLSMVFGTPTRGTWFSLYSSAPRRKVPSPPITTRASIPSRCSRAAATPPSWLCGLTLEVPRIVPPLGRMPLVTRPSSGTLRPSITPRQPSAKPTNSSLYTTSPLRTTARMTALRPGQSPPPVSTPTLILSCQLPLEGPIRTRPNPIGTLSVLNLFQETTLAPPRRCETRRLSLPGCLVPSLQA